MINVWRKKQEEAAERQAVRAAEKLRLAVTARPLVTGKWSWSYTLTDLLRKPKKKSAFYGIRSRSTKTERQFLRELEKL